MSEEDLEVFNSQTSLWKIYYDSFILRRKPKQQKTCLDKILSVKY